MTVWILTSEPYHDNGSIIGVYTTQAEGVGQLTAEMETTDFNADDMRLTEWDLTLNVEVRRWDKYGRQRYALNPDGRGTVPVGKTFILSIEQEKI